MFRRVLVANRGEIAVRIIRACRDLGVSPVTIHSEADRDSLHVRLADESFEVGGAASRDSYLNGERVIEAARAMDAEALHPGYGFLAENGDFAARCAERGLVFVGPPPEAMRRMGDKAAARETAVKAGVRVVPGSDIVSGKDAERAAAGIGFPLLIKAAAGGGGMGMRLVRDPSNFSDSLREAQSEAEAAFGDARVFLERFVENPRHVEIQVFGDDAGCVVHLGERDCSIQRRNQKLLEESPSPAISPELRAGMGEAAVRLARGAGYRNAGTVEFLLDPEGRFYFLEMNARLQVEHPVTELISGMDLVALQLRVAAGEPLGFLQSEVSLSGAAIELRITAEDPFAGFVPATGRIREFRPPAGPGVRCDAGIVSGSVVSPHYDPLLAKIIVSGPDRETARKRAIRAVRETRLIGVASTLPFFERVLASVPFCSGNFDTSFVAAHWSAPQPERSGRRVGGAGRTRAPGARGGGGRAVAARRLELERGRRIPVPVAARRRRRGASGSILMRRVLSLDGKDCRVEVRAEPGGATLRVGIEGADGELVARETPGGWTITNGRRTVEAGVSGERSGELVVQIAEHSYRLETGRGAAGGSRRSGPAAGGASGRTLRSANPDAGQGGTPRAGRRRAGRRRRRRAGIRSDEDAERDPGAGERGHR